MDLLDKPLDQIVKDRRLEAQKQKKQQQKQEKPKKQQQAASTKKPASQQQKPASSQQKRGGASQNARGSRAGGAPRGGNAGANQRGGNDSRAPRGANSNGKRGRAGPGAGPIRREHAGARAEPYPARSTPSNRAEGAWSHDKFDQSTGGSKAAERVALEKTPLSVRRLGEPDQVGKVNFSNVKPDILSDELRELFNNYGAVQEISLRYDRAGRSTGEGFVRFATSDIARKCVADLDQAEVEGQAITLKLVTPAPLSAAAKPKLRMDQERSANRSRSGAVRGNAAGAAGSRASAPGGRGPAGRSNKVEPTFVVRLEEPRSGRSSRGGAGAAGGRGGDQRGSRRGSRGSRQ
eukprot:CAMPEP_0174235942 /NCGR_PEP_ID=MMETSP0417-20130205/5227_1 /TAXON_ID=242541 /ORGANISM="Mayorella sp, Strain BSH-02190019" /LENGTH=348 /DNA_ID=CAMNT_0015314521 /DNA_START=198 /DNA_END=1247 /DNA_ORIENTATION=-